MKIPIYNQKGEEIDEIELPKEIFGVRMNSDLVHQAVIAQMTSSRKVLAHTKTRGEVCGSGRKPWRQKGTGRARAGSIRSPLWKGGGVTFGPRKERNFKKKINKKMKRKALFMVLSSKVKDKELIVLDKIGLEKVKTKEMAEIITQILKLKTQSHNAKLRVKKDKSVLITLSRKDENVIRSARNIPKVKTILADSLNVVDLLSYKYLLMPKEAIGVIEKTYKSLHNT